MIKSEPAPGLSVFREVARLGSFTAAADHLDISASAVSQSVRVLEQRLGVRLFNRTSRQVRLSEAGSAFLQQIEAPLRQIEMAMRQLQADQEGQPWGLLRINLSRLAAALLVTPRLPEFLARYPRLQLELYTDDALSDLVAGGFDAGIRLGWSLAKDMIALPIDNGQRRVVVATPDYLRRHGHPQTPADLSGHDCIRFRFSGSGRLEPWYFVEQGQALQVEVSGRLIFADDRLTIAATCAGLGLSQRFRQSLLPELESGHLIEVLRDHEATLPGFHLYYPAREHMPPKLRAFIDFMREPISAPQ